MSVNEKILVLSDLHFGSGDDLLRSPTAVEVLKPELAWADTLLLNGDVFDFLGAGLADAIEASKHFFAAASEHVKKIIFLPGNHDYHFVAQATDRHRFSQFLGISGETPFRLHLAEMLIEELTDSRCKVQTAYPMIEISGIVFLHGHYMSPHLRNFTWRMFDQLSWRLAGLERTSKNLTVSDYEALMAPLHELLYQSSQLPSSSRTRMSGERFLTFAANVLRAPGRLQRRASSLVRTHAEEDSFSSKALFQLTRPSEATEAMAEVCTNLGFTSGPICFGHSHAPFDALEVGGWSMYNSGSWILDHREMHYPHYSNLAWPGTVLRVEDGIISRRDLLKNYELEELAGMLNEELPALPLVPQRMRKPHKRRRQRNHLFP